MNRSFWAVVGYVLLVIGFTAIFLSLVGLHHTFLGWLYAFGDGVAFATYILFVLLGFVILYMARVDLSDE